MTNRQFKIFVKEIVKYLITLGLILVLMVIICNPGGGGGTHAQVCYPTANHQPLKWTPNGVSHHATFAPSMNSHLQNITLLSVFWLWCWGWYPNVVLNIYFKYFCLRGTPKVRQKMHQKIHFQKMWTTPNVWKYTLSTIFFFFFFLYFF